MRRRMLASVLGAAGLFLQVAAAGPPLPPALPPPFVPFASLDKGMGVGTRDESFSVGLHLMLQTRFEHIEKDAGRDDGFKIIPARPALRGAAFRKWIQYFVQWELAGAATTLLDAQISVEPCHELGLTVGQFLTPFSREFLVPPGALLFPDFAPSNIAFRNNRDVGAMLSGALFDKRLEYWAGAVNGNGINKPSNDNAQLEWFGRFAVNAIGSAPYTEIPQLVTKDTGLTLGVNASYVDTEQTANAFDAKTGAVTTTKLGSSPTTKTGGDVMFHRGPLSVQVEAYARMVQAVGGGARKSARGGFAQAGVFVIDRTLELAARADLTDMDASRANVLDKRVDGGVNYDLKDNHLKLQLRYAWADSPNALAPSVKGNSNTVSLQAQLWF